MTITPIGRRRLSDAAVEQLLGLIRSGDFAVGEKLPSERDLARELNVSRVSVRESFRILEALGVIEVRTGIGAFVAEQSPVTAQIANYLRSHPSEVLDVVDVRAALATLAGQLASQRLTDDELAELDRLLCAQREAHAQGQAAELVELDEAFHALIFQGTRNQVLLAMFRYTREVLGGVQWNHITLWTRTEQSLDEHERIMVALRQRNSKAAAKALQDHANRANAAMRKAISRLAGAQAERRPGARQPDS